jgi:hypothetical protein
MPIKGKRHSNAPVGHEDKADSVDCGELVQIGSFEILPSAIEVAPRRRQEAQLYRG